MVTCDLCGYAVPPIKRVMLMVEGRAMNEHRLCIACLNDVFDSLQKFADARRAGALVPTLERG